MPAAKKTAKTKTKPEQKKKIRVTQLKSVSGRLPAHVACITGLGLRRIRHSVELEDTACVRGMINKVSYMVAVEEIS
ncbi:MAG: 50S ribosomal protein L30 [Gammaproteobacteria bacterium]